MMAHIGDDAEGLDTLEVYAYRRVTKLWIINILILIFACVAFISVVWVGNWAKDSTTAIVVSNLTGILKQQ